MEPEFFTWKLSPRFTSEWPGNKVDRYEVRGRLRVGWVLRYWLDTF
jgi:hypothetical protein